MLTERIRTAMEEQMAACENPFYLYDQKTILEQTGRLKQDFPGFEFLYSIKTNPFLPVVKTVLGQGFGLDAASLREVQIGVEQGLPREKILYSAPGKTRRDLEGAVDHAILVADSLHELELLDGIAQQRGQRLQVGVRVNPSFTMEGDPGTPAKFGIDEEQLLALDLARFPHLEMVGIHVHARSQELDASMLARYYGDIFALAVCGAAGHLFGVCEPGGRPGDRLRPGPGQGFGHRRPGHGGPKAAGRPEGAVPGGAGAHRERPLRRL